MRIIVNGDHLEVESGLSLVSLLARLGKPSEHVAVEHNGNVVEGGSLTEVMLRENDQLEIVHFVGGG